MPHYGSEDNEFRKFEFGAKTHFDKLAVIRQLLNFSFTK